ncbi:MAG TPA: tagaturonate epimerase family protein, partial [Anaerolineales bacterium]|nr:tagaturonate epimerase family protein [Anaerolineales bacterium]
MLSPLGLSPSFGFGDRLGLATPGHIASVKGTKFAPIFAQQSVRENTRTGRTPQQVMDDAKRAVDAAKWDSAWGADADHLKTVDDIPPFIAAGYTFFTVDPGEHVDNGADTDSVDVLKQKVAALGWDELSALYLSGSGEQVWGQFEAESLMQATVKYGRAIAHAVSMFKRLSELRDAFDFEVSVDETDSPTTPLEHFFIANELTRKGVKFTSLAPRFIGRFEKGVDYIGDLSALDVEMSKHAAVTAHFGTYKLSLHSGSDKFSVYPLVAKHWGERLHVKTAGTSYLEALRVLAKHEPDLFTKIYSLGRERYETDKKTYHVSAELNRLPNTDDLPSLLEDFHAREVLHVTFGSALAQFGVELKAALVKHDDAYFDG